MAPGNSNSTKNKSLMSFLSASECIPWLVENVIECLVIVAVNIITIIVFVKERQLQRLSTYLIIHLAVVDLLVGAVSGPLNIYFGIIEYYCGLWPTMKISFVQFYVCRILVYMLPLTSLVNLVVISVERFYAIFRPFRHRVIKKWVFGMLICVIWLPFIVCGFVEVIYFQSKWDVLVQWVMHSSYYGMCLFVICASCVSSVISFRNRSFPRHVHHGATARERKLTVTLFIVAFASLLCWLPHVIFSLSVIATDRKIIGKLSGPTRFHVYSTLTALSFGNSLLNPIVYALRMPGFRLAAIRLFRRVPNNRITPVSFRLSNLQ